MWTFSVGTAASWKVETKDQREKKQSDQVWVVVEVQSGIPVLAEVFAEKPAAKRLERKLRRNLRQDYDAAGIFEATVRH
jgi:hypothetical protein